MNFIGTNEFYNFNPANCFNGDFTGAELFYPKNASVSSNFPIRFEFVDLRSDVADFCRENTNFSVLKTDDVFSIFFEVEKSAALAVAGFKLKDYPVYCVKPESGSAFDTYIYTYHWKHAECNFTVTSGIYCRKVMSSAMSLRRRNWRNDLRHFNVGRMTCIVNQQFNL